MEAHWPDIAGRWREQQVWIGGSRFGPHEADFIPPHHDRVPAAMADLAAFMARPDLPVLTQAAIAHAQFETIHPFPDGNGRVGRALVHSLLKAGGLARSVTVPVSAGLLGDTGTYFAADGIPRVGSARGDLGVGRIRQPGSQTPFSLTRPAGSDVWPKSVG